jgi:hypothetical protein
MPEDYEQWVETEGWAKDRRWHISKLEAIADTDTPYELELREVKTKHKRWVKGLLSKKVEAHPDWDRLRLCTMAHQYGWGDPWAVKIVEDLSDEKRKGAGEEEIPEIKVLPKVRPSLGARKGQMLATLIKDREEKKKK